MLPEGASGRVDELLARFLAGRSKSTVQAYTCYLGDFARFHGLSLVEAVSKLLTSSERCQRIVLDYAVNLRRRGLSQATARRRIGTLHALVELAGRLGAADWSLQVPNEEDVRAADLISAGHGTYVAYVLPRDVAEIDRLDVQHYALCEALGGNYLAPVDRPSRILDAGSGTGQWAYDLCEEFPEALAVGFDLEVSKRPWPAAYHFVRGNLLHGLPFASDQFDFVHQRALISGVPVSSWASVTGDLVRVTRPGGWVELVEHPVRLESAGPAAERFLDLVQRTLRAHGLPCDDTVANGLDRYLRRAGLADVQRRDVDLPVGEWGGRVGSLMATDARALLIRFAAVIPTALGIPQCECLELITEMQEVWEQHHSAARFVHAFGRKPA